MANISNYKNYFTTDIFKQYMSTPFISGRYISVLTPYGSAVKQIFASGSTEKMCVLISEINLPNMSYGMKNVYVGGTSVDTINSFETNDNIKIKVYDTGIEYKLFYSWGEAQYNQTNHTFSFPNDLLMNFSVLEFGKDGSLIYTHNYFYCSMKDYSKDGNLSYESKTEISKINVTMTYRKYSLS